MSHSVAAGDGPAEVLVVNKEAFNATTIEDELRADQLCQQLLRRYYDSLLAAGVAPHDATALANGADYYVRDFLVGYKQRNLFDERTGIVRQFAGNWYIVNTLEPGLDELAGHLRGVASFYGFLAEHGLISSSFLAAVAAECADLDYYERRIATFWAIERDGYLAWERECSLKDF